MPKITDHLDAQCHHEHLKSSRLEPSISLPSEDKCPKCGGLLATRLNSFQGGRVLELYCAICGKVWPLWGEERVIHHDKQLTEGGHHFTDVGLIGMETATGPVRA